MRFIESSLCRLQDCFSGFVVPSAALQDAGALKAQIELRRQALKDIELIRCRLRPFMRREEKVIHRGLRSRRRPISSRRRMSRWACASASLMPD